jgi:arsenate reductase
MTTCEFDGGTMQTPQLTLPLPRYTYFFRRQNVSGFTIYHNPRCTKSRATLALLEEHGIKPRIIEYLQTPPDKIELKAILSKLGIEAVQLVRKGEQIYKDEYAHTTMSEGQWIAAMIAHPILIERPIVVHGNRAVIGRPPENVKQLLP